MKAPTTSPPPSLEQQVELIRYVAAVLKHKLWVFTSTVILGAACYAYSYTLPELYEAFVQTDLVDIEDPGGVSPDNRRSSEVLTLVEHGFVLSTTKSNYLAVSLAKMRSRDFSLLFIDKYNIEAQLYPQHWNTQTASWMDGFTPDRATTLKIFHAIRFIDHDPETDIISIRFRLSQPTLARDWANLYVAEFNHYARQKALQEVERKQQFLRTHLDTSHIVDIQQSIYRLIEAQTAVAMLANAREDYVLDVIDAAIMPLERFSPSRKTYFILGAFTGAMLNITWIIGCLLIKDIRAALHKYALYPHDSTL